MSPPDGPHRICQGPRPLRPRRRHTSTTTAGGRPLDPAATGRPQKREGSMPGIHRRELLKGTAAAAVSAALIETQAAPAGASPPAGSTCAGFSTPGGRDFPKVGGNLGNQNYSALEGIHRGNIRRLGGAWVNRIEGGITTGTNQSTAVAVDGVLYIESAFGNVVAVDGATGITKWKYTQTRGNLTRRGVAVGHGMVFTHGKGSWIIALDQQTGQVAWE